MAVCNHMLSNSANYIFYFMCSAAKIKDNGRMLLFLYMAALFVALSPGVLARFPKNCSKFVVAATHGLAYIVVFSLTYKFVMRLGRRIGYEGFQDPPMPPPSMGPSMGPPMGPPPSMPQQPMASPPPMGPPPTMVPPMGSGPMPMPADQSSSGANKLAAMNIMISTGSGMATNPCKNGNDCASGMCMAGKCM